MIRMLLQVVALLTIAVGLAACQTTSRSEAPINSRIDELGIMNELQPGEVHVVRRNGLLNIQAEVINLSNRAQSLYYRFQWLNEAGLLAWEEESWKPVLIQGQQRKWLTTVAPTPQATDFRIEMHSPDNATPIDLFTNK
ncbi:MAG: YcfL family protein [Magnetococcales bacterium]|nr:YcfL family protein [Magnetococcales bacterium]